MEEYDAQNEMQSTMSDIDSFEQRLQLKTFQEGLKHKAASVDITPAIVDEAMTGGLADYRAKLQVMEASDELPAQPDVLEQEALSAAAAPLPDNPVVHEPSAVSGTPTAAEGERRLLVLEILHGSDLRGPDLEWKSGVRAAVCHPFCLVMYRMQLARGKTIRSSRNPVFRDAISLQAPAAGPLGPLTLSVYCEEQGEADTLVGSVEVDVDAIVDGDPKASTDGAHRWVDLQGGASGSLHLNFKVLIVGK